MCVIRVKLTVKADLSGYFPESCNHPLGWWKNNKTFWWRNTEICRSLSLQTSTCSQRQPRNFFSVNRSHKMSFKKNKRKSGSAQSSCSWRRRSAFVWGPRSQNVRYDRGFKLPALTVEERPKSLVTVETVQTVKKNRREETELDVFRGR